MTARLSTEKPAPPAHRPAIELAYLVFVFLPLFFWPQHPARALWTSLLAVALFVPMFVAFHRDPVRWRGLIAVVAALGFALIPLNPGGNTFVIYAVAMAGVVLRPRTAVALAIALLAATAAEFVFVMPNLGLALGYIVMISVIASLVLVGVLVERDRTRRNAELKLSQEEVARLAALAERERIGRDLHDLLGHTLSVVALKCELAGRLVGPDPDAARRQIGEVETVARQALAQVREAVVGIRAAGLQAELAAARLALLSAEIRLDQQLAPVELPAAVESTLAMALREAVTNVIRHAGARRVEVELRADAGGMRLAIADDGRGGVGRAGNGLAGMGERLAALGGALEIDSPPGGGTRLLLRLPPTALTLASGTYPVGTGTDPVGKPS
ncbi:sensor histidine kinase [Arenimonas composti]|uniref:Histidine kinase/HSP90-like ATPase domain-containing protein n=1 Tax=Arenimonas composti TR7-09 = DSM 18010 TaxID=1121013 RepID=A0A091BXZ5_9GAMM|nr:sensor histidine kinase [Arenimonas composti]KFN49225.1 hypothetical protein P873_11715 [Arenimonas composti TR7-09 = DSM 18010]